MEVIIKKVRFDKRGFVPAAIQDYRSMEVLMLTMLDAEALEKTLESGRLHYFSPIRRKVRKKGETSGHYQEIAEIRLDCDDDALLIKVRPAGGICHEGFMSCFHRVLEDGSWKVDKEPDFDPKAVYPEYTYK